MIVSVCRAPKHGLQWPRTQATETHVIRLPAADAMQAMLILLQHPAVAIWGDDENV